MSYITSSGIDDNTIDDVCVMATNDCNIINFSTECEYLNIILDGE